MKLLLTLALMGLAGAALAPVHGADTWPVQLTYPRQVGQTYGLGMQVERQVEVTLSLNGETVREQKFSSELDFDGTIEVTAVNDRQLATAATITVKTLTLAIDGPAQTIYPAGTILTATQEADGLHFTLGGEPVNSLAQQALASLLLIYDGRATSDEIFGPDHPVAVGETWTVNQANAARNSSDERLTLQPEDVSGTVTLEGVEEIDGQRCLKVSGEMTLQNLIPPNVPTNMIIDHGTLALKTTSLLPVGTDNGPLEKTAAVTINFSASSQSPEGPVLFRSSMIENRTERYTFP